MHTRINPHALEPRHNIAQTDTHTMRLSVLTLNIRGLRHKTKFIKDLSNEFEPDFILLQETNVHTSYLQHILEKKLKPEIKNVFWTIDKKKTPCRGVAILQTNDKWTVKRHDFDNGGRIGMTEISKNNKTVHLYNIYGPASSDDNIFYRQVREKINQNKHDKIIIGGDFNVTLDAYDSTNMTRLRTTKKAEQLIKIINDHNLNDAYRLLNPLGKDTTYNTFRNNGKRLDRILATPNIHPSKVAHIAKTKQYTDHKGVLVHFGDESINKKTPTYWKFNNSLLGEKYYINYITPIIKQYMQEIPDSDIDIWWDMFKSTIKTMTINISKKLKYVSIRQERQLTETIEILKTIDPQDLDLLDMEDQLHDIRQKKLKGNQTRCSSKYMTNKDSDLNDMIRQIEHSTQKSRQITKITDINGQETDDPKKITEAFHEYYKALYTKEDTDVETEDKYTGFARQLTKEQSDELDTPITLEDIISTIKNLNLGKSPGPDGLTSEFYLHFADLVGPGLHTLIEYIHRTGQLTDTQNTSYITLIPKTTSNSTDMKNYRPISLLNTDYKIITKTLARKLRSYIPTLIHPDQTCAIDGRNIEQNTHTIRDIIDYTNNRQNSTIILSTDQEKAFDRLAHSFIHKTLEKSNIGKYFREWVKILYKNPEGNVIVNHEISQPFKIGRSVRQGCPLSAMLYTLCLETFLESVRKDPLILGTKIPGNDNKKLVAYADDTTFFPRDVKSMNRVISCFKDFGKGSGSKINVEKSKAMQIGKLEHMNNYNTEIEWVREIKILGIIFRDRNKHLAKDYYKTIHKLEKKVHKYKFLQTTIFERAKIVNTYFIPQFLYFLKVHSPPPSILNKAKQIITKYVLQNTNRRISYSTLTLPTHLGGTGLHDIRQKLNTFRLMFIEKVIKDPDGNGIATYYLGTRLTKFHPLDHKKPHFGGTTPPKFYQLCGQLISKHLELLGKGFDSKTIYDKMTIIDHKSLEFDAGLTLDMTKTAHKNIHCYIVSKEAKEAAFKTIYSLLFLQNNTCRLCKASLHTTAIKEQNHILLYCPATQPIVQTAIKHISSSTSAQVHLQLSLQHNIIPYLGKETHYVNINILAEVRQAIWLTCTKNAEFPIEKMKNIIINTVIHLLSKLPHPNKYYNFLKTLLKNTQAPA